MPAGVQLTAGQTRQLCFNVIDKLIELHRVDWKAAGLEKLGKGDGYAKRQIDGWCDRWDKARTWNVLPGRDVMRWLKRSEEHTSELQSLMRISYAVFCLKKKKTKTKR